MFQGARFLLGRFRLGLPTPGANAAACGCRLAQAEWVGSYCPSAFHTSCMSLGCFFIGWLLTMLLFSSRAKKIGPRRCRQDPLRLKLFWWNKTLVSHLVALATLWRRALWDGPVTVLFLVPRWKLKGRQEPLKRKMSKKCNLCGCKLNRKESLCGSCQLLWIRFDWIRFWIRFRIRFGCSAQFWRSSSWCLSILATYVEAPQVQRWRRCCAMASEVNPSSLCLYPVLGWGSDTCASGLMFGGMECRCSFEEGECKASAGFSPETINLQDRCWHWPWWWLLTIRPCNVWPARLFWWRSWPCKSTTGLGRRPFSTLWIWSFASYSSSS